MQLKNAPKLTSNALYNVHEESMDRLQSEYQVADMFILNSISSAQFVAEEVELLNDCSSSLGLPVSL